MTGNTDGPDADFCARDQFGQKDGTGSLVEYSARFLAAQVSSSQHSAQFVLNMAPFNFQPSSAGTPFWSHVPQRETTNVHASGQVCMFEGKNGRDFRAFTSALLLFIKTSSRPASSSHGRLASPCWLCSAS
jgi:hypothetical protein